ncbi:MAG TPA: hypothetical protein VMF30_17155, partial [Pirellulales bacterium]|nr:hypothetical protein [Pirellulales bacterium]
MAAYAPAQSPLPPPDKLPAPSRAPSLSERLKMPKELPGSEAPPIRIPPRDVLPAPGRGVLIDQIFPNRPLPAPLAGPSATLMSLKQIEELALANNPEMVQAAADITSAAGTAVQAGVHPNPTIGYEADTVGSAG